MKRAPKKPPAKVPLVEISAAPDRLSAAEVYLSKWPASGDTYKTMRGALDCVARVLGGKNAKTFAWGDVRYETARSVPAKLTEAGGAKGKPLGMHTVNKLLAAFRGVLETAWRRGDLPSEAYRAIKIENIAGHTLAAGRALSAAEVDVIEASLEKVPPQNAAIVAVLSAYGLRRVELVRLRTENFDLGTGRIVAHGKRNKERSIPIPTRWRQVVEAWWATLAPKAFAFASKDGRPLTRRQVAYVVEKFYKVAGVKKFTSHDLRRTFITRICETSDIGIAQRLAGHVSSDVTARYDRRGEAAEDKAVKGL